METFLYFSSIGSLFTYLNVILIGAVVFWAINRFTYIIDVIVYALAKTFIPMITLLLIGSLVGVNASLGIGTIFVMLILYFILGLAVIKITEKITDYFSSDTVVYFIIVFAIIDIVVSWLFSLIIGLLV